MNNKKKVNFFIIESTLQYNSKKKCDFEMKCKVTQRVREKIAFWIKP